MTQTTLLNSPFMSLDAVLSDFNDFIHSEGENFISFFIDHNLLEKATLAVIFRKINDTFVWFYEQMHAFETILIPLDASFALLEIVAGFFDGMVELMRTASSNNDMIPETSDFLEKITNLIPADFEAEEWVERLNVLPAATVLILLKTTILSLVGATQVETNTLPAGQEETTGSLEQLMQLLNN